MFHGLATKEDFWKERINVFIALAPVIRANKNNLLFKIGSKAEKFLEKRLASAGIYEMFGKNWDEVSKLVQVITPGYNKILLISFTYA
jgi:hypothetical protein